VGWNRCGRVLIHAPTPRRGRRSWKKLHLGVDRVQYLEPDDGVGSAGLVRDRVVTIAGSAQMHAALVFMQQRPRVRSGTWEDHDSRLPRVLKRFSARAAGALVQGKVVTGGRVE
jgi:hypothetical protein